jgi:hypothetical protein
VPPADVSRLLSRLANDAALRDLLASDPDTALSGYTLTDEEARRIRAGGTDALSLLTWEARGAQRPPSRSTEAPAAPLLAGQPMPHVELLLSLSPTLQTAEDGTQQLAHVAALHSPDAPDLSGVLFRLRVAPLALPQPDGTLQVSYTAVLDPLAAAHDPTQQPDTAVPTAPWGHDTESAGVLAAAAAVRSADPAERYAALLDLIAAVTA